jgi:hypothetical protein
MTVLLASELTEADLALLVRPEAPALRLGGLRLLARAAGVRPPTAANLGTLARPVVQRHPPRGWPGNPHDGSCVLRAS